MAAHSKRNSMNPRLQPIRSASLAFAVVVAVFSSPTDASSQELPPPSQVLYSEDFEGYAIGSTEIEGEALSTEPRDTRVTNVLPGPIALESKQLVTSSGSFRWRTKQIDLAQPMLTSVSIALEAFGGVDGFAETDRVKITAELEHDQVAPRALLDLGLSELELEDGFASLRGELPLGTFAERFWDTTVIDGSSGRWGGIKTQPSWVRFIIEVTMAGNLGNHVALDNLTVTQQANTLREWASGLKVSTEFSTLSGVDAASAVIVAEYRSDSVVVELADISSGEICLTSIRPAPGDETFPVEVLDVETDPETGGVQVRFRMDRPQRGWSLLPWFPSLSLCKGGQPSRRIDSALSSAWSVAPWSGVDDYVFLEPERTDPIQGDEPFVDFTTRIDAQRRFPLDLIDVIQPLALMSLGSEAPVPAEFREVTEVSEDGRTVRMVYRLHRPEFGWPAREIWIYLASDLRVINGTRSGAGTNVLRVAPGRPFVRVSLPPTEPPPPNVSVFDNPSYDQSISASEDTFRVVVRYASTESIVVATIESGDVLLDGSVLQPGRLIGTEALENGLQVDATFEFDRDPVAYSSSEVLLRFPTGSVFDRAGGTNFGLDLLPLPVDPDRPARVRQVSVEREEEADISTGLIPRSTLSTDLEAYRFRVVFESRGSPLRSDDFDKAHVLLEGLNRTALGDLEETRVLAQTTGKEISEDGRVARIDYRMDKPASGWPSISRIRLANGGVRDIDGGTIFERDLAIIGEGESADAQLISGSIIDGDPETHTLSLLVRVRPEWLTGWFPNVGDYSEAYGWLGPGGQILPSFDEEVAPAQLGRLAPIVYPVGYESGENPITLFRGDGGLMAVLNLKFDRPEGGWDVWGLGDIPYVVQAPSLKNVPNSVIATGTIRLANRVLPLLSNFDDWIRDLEERAELPEGSLRRDPDGDGQRSLIEFALGSDPTDPNSRAHVVPEKVVHDGMPCAQLTFDLRDRALGVTGELQYSPDGETWQSADEDFRVVSRTPIGDGFTRLILLSKRPIVTSTGLYRIVVAPIDYTE